MDRDKKREREGNKENKTIRYTEIDCKIQKQKENYYYRE